jgi:hypothetical protein
MKRSFRRMVGDLIHADGDEVHEHDLGNRPQAGNRGAYRGPDESHLGDRRGTHPVGTVLGREALSHLDDAAALGVRDFLAEQDHVRILGERVVQRPVDRLDGIDLLGTHDAALEAAEAA